MFEKYWIFTMYTSNIVQVLPIQNILNMRWRRKAGPRFHLSVCTDVEVKTKNSMVLSVIEDGCQDEIRIVLSVIQDPDTKPADGSKSRYISYEDTRYRAKAPKSYTE